MPFNSARTEESYKKFYPELEDEQELKLINRYTGRPEERMEEHPDLLHYKLYMEPDLDELLEYDMDEQDDEWLKLFNKESVLIDRYQFEYIMDLLEKKWFYLTKDLQKNAQEPLGPEDSICNICNDGECENSNAIVFCDGCNLAVHQECYGVPYIPEGQWLCRKCMVSPDKPVKCIFCPNSGGALKQTTTNEWAHLLCTMWIPEVNVSNPVYMEPIEGVDKIPKSRWKLRCTLCGHKHGACIQCYKPTCYASFHVTCARKEHLFMQVKHSGDQSTYKVFCNRHAPPTHSNKLMKMNVIVQNPEELETDVIANSNPVDESVESLENDATSNINLEETPVPHKRKRLGFDPSNPVAPFHIIEQVMNHLDEHNIIVKQKSKVVNAVAKYWSLKRSSKRGAPLLKRLLIEPWTAFSTSVRENEAIQLENFKILTNLRTDLEKIRMMTEMVRKREKEKLKGLQIIHQFCLLKMDLAGSCLKPCLENLRKVDKKQFFEFPVNEQEVPDYYEHIKHPMTFQQMQEKLDNHEYTSISEFQKDVELIISNATFYNKPDTAYSKMARKIEADLPAILKEAQDEFDLHIKEEEISVNEHLKEVKAMFDYPEVNLHDLKLFENEMDEDLSIASGSMEQLNVVIPKSKHKMLSSPKIAKTPSPVKLKSESSSTKIGQKRTTRNSMDSVPLHEIQSSPDYGKRKTEDDTNLQKKIKLENAIKIEVKVPKLSADSVNIIPGSFHRRGKRKSSSPLLKTAVIGQEFNIILELMKKEVEVFNKSYKMNIGWAKLKGYPWFPAEIIDPTSNSIPQHVLDIKPNEPGVFLARFIDRDLFENRTFIWCKNDTFTPFDYGQEDVSKLIAAIKRGGSMQKQVILGYDLACRSRGQDSEKALNNAGISIQRENKSEKPEVPEVKRLTEADTDGSSSIPEDISTDDELW